MIDLIYFIFKKSLNHFNFLAFIELDAAFHSNFEKNRWTKVIVLNGLHRRYHKSNFIKGSIEKGISNFFTIASN